MWRRRPIVPCSPAEIERLAAAFLAGRQVEELRLLDGGRCNSNYRFRAGAAVYVFRRYAREDPAAQRRESAAMALAGNLVPVPGVLASGIGWTVGRFLPGSPLGQAPAPEAVVAAGRALAAIGSVRFPAVGDVLAGEATEPGPSEGPCDFLEASLGQRRVQESLGDLLLPVRELLRRERPRFEEMEQDARLVHGDFRPDNLLVEGGRISGVLDWEFAHAGSPYEDVGNLMRHLGAPYADAVATGLCSGGFPLPSDWVRRAALADLGSHLEFLGSEDIQDAAFRRLCVDRVRTLLD